MSSPSITISPAVGSIRRIRQRTIVDLPLPDSPMITKVSPRFTWNETSCRPMTLPNSLWKKDLSWSEY